jgi:hypothetical protein
MYLRRGRGEARWPLSGLRHQSARGEPWRHPDTWRFATAARASCIRSAIGAARARRTTTLSGHASDNPNDNLMWAGNQPSASCRPSWTSAGDDYLPPRDPRGSARLLRKPLAPPQFAHGATTTSRSCAARPTAGGLRVLRTARPDPPCACSGRTCPPTRPMCSRSQALSSTASEDLAFSTALPSGVCPETSTPRSPIGQPTAQASRTGPDSFVARHASARVVLRLPSMFSAEFSVSFTAEPFSANTALCARRSTRSSTSTAASSPACRTATASTSWVGRFRTGPVPGIRGRLRPEWRRSSSAYSGMLRIRRRNRNNASFVGGHVQRVPCGAAGTWTACSSGSTS